MKHHFTFLYLITIIIFPSFAVSQAYPDRHSTLLSESWLSCTATPNPNAPRGNSHWVRIDMGDTYALSTSKFWNFNVPYRANRQTYNTNDITELPGRTDDGLKNVMIDYSIDGITWLEWGRFNMPKAPGSTFYQGDAGPDFNGLIARYILITALSNHGGDCYGLSELKIKATSATVSAVNDALKDAIFEASPNPFQSETTVTAANFLNEPITFKMTNADGVLVWDKYYDRYDQKLSFTIPAKGLPSGVYFLIAEQQRASKTIKLVIIK